MASQSQGIQQLLQAEKRAAEKVADARKRKARRLKQAKEEAQMEVEQYRREREQEFQSKQQAEDITSDLSPRASPPPSSRLGRRFLAPAGHLDYGPRTPWELEGLPTRVARAPLEGRPERTPAWQKPKRRDRHFPKASAEPADL
ncbi:V-type proton ATPase subunit G 2 isoform X2 [Lemur catta]|uniref:V-type proton ATPase subunit G 2 isoform X2 n=1 Tax=Lemur catta TaxID=9447 RepID=UPI001E26DB32|nr:V-type proton ATPase subunit G 2 isoform X2 [Lemur catta]